MPPQFKIVCRGSRLSLAQADIVIKRIQRFNPEVVISTIIKETRGDVNQITPLEQLEGRDFFTKDIQDVLLTGQADFAVHSLKDVSGENFFKDNHYAIIEREDPRDVAIFNPDVLEKLTRGDNLLVGTSSPRRAEMAIRFLRRALPNSNSLNTRLLAAPIRGNVDTRLQKLNNHEFDGIILACAGLNRLLRYEAAKEYVTELLIGKRMMVLPLIECPPAPGQGAIVVECIRKNENAAVIVKAINDADLAKAVEEERKVAGQFGSGCHQKFGAVHIDTGSEQFVHASGKDRSDKDFSVDHTIKESVIVEKKSRQPDHGIVPKDIRVMDAIENDLTLEVPEKKTWVSKTALWYELARRGAWVHGSLEGFGIQFNASTLNSPLVNIQNSTHR